MPGPWPPDPARGETRRPAAAITAARESRAQLRLIIAGAVLAFAGWWSSSPRTRILCWLMSLAAAGAAPASRGLTRTDAYILCSVAGDLKIAVPVLGPGHASNVTFHVPLSVF